MDHKISVLVQVDLDGAYVRLLVTGGLTEANQHALYPLIRRARTLIPPVAVSVDLTAAEHVEPIAVDLLRWAVDHDETMAGTSPVEVLTPAGAPDRTRAPGRKAPHLRDLRAGRSALA